jgi:hypothetical protein
MLRGSVIGRMDQELRAKCARVKNLCLPCDSDENSSDYEEYGPQEGYESDDMYDEFFLLGMLERMLMNFKYYDVLDITYHYSTMINSILWFQMHPFSF